MRVTVNGDERDLAERLTVADAVAELSGRSSGVAVAVNGEVVPRGRWAETPLSDGDRIEVLSAAQGG
ncbi:sulfur carrier protein ThiS [Catenuloplanes atrovinosus]|uniref:Sulfur carrier protein n=1 Tax=Catenuloplanes atrovinosus TaxID=137266 RepID=A0AAE4CFA8_9ACTN|nr:sulfur carrier protein ThiS [Catenuloplanes atrovinosus]MDR7279435.1 sulfur carrier protein [Catenuloplanes atrovinosus]